MEVAFHRDKFDCRACRWQRHCDERNPAPFPMFAIAEIGLESRTCLLPMITDASRERMRLYRHYKNHLLPLAGGVLDQPNAYLEAMEVIDAHQSKLLSETARG
ncbi:MAG: hypothetical protein MZW92_31865 [Comamonadaceae bacterium]|nr:hypothetical protein [Comamonadaceae bacterium]